MTTARNESTRELRREARRAAAETLLRIVEEEAFERGEAEYLFQPHDDGKRDTLLVRRLGGEFLYLLRLEPTDASYWKRDQILMFIGASL